MAEAKKVLEASHPSQSEIDRVGKDLREAIRDNKTEIAVMLLEATPHIIQNIMTKVLNKSPVARELKAFGSQLSQTNIQLIITSLSTQLNDANRSVCQAAATAKPQLLHWAQ